MTRERGRLTALSVCRVKSQGLHGDGGGLYLRVAEGGTKSWVYRYQRGGRRHSMGLGSLDVVSLADARRRATDARRTLSDGHDPITAGRAAVRARLTEEAKTIAFAEAANRFVEVYNAAWRSKKHRAQWLGSLRGYAFPVFGDEAVAAVDVNMVLKVLLPIWVNKTETARRLRGRIEAILDWAKVGGLRQGENPARWRGHLQHLLPKRPANGRVQHHPALAYSDIAEFMATLRKQPGTAARALEFTILTGARTSEVTGATWDEVDFKQAQWTVPASRTKAGREHRVPLSGPAIAILKIQSAAKIGGVIFPGVRRDRGLSSAAMACVLRRMKRSDITVHGFRSTFRDWASERTNYPREVAEMALAHAVGDKVEAAYRRGDLLEKRRQFMADWASFCERPSASKGPKVVPIGRRSSGSER